MALHGHGRGYAGCGDWLPDEAKFDDLTSTIATIRSRGASVALWVAPLLLGARSAAFAALRQFAPYRHEDLKCHVLDPRRREVRQHVADTCLRLVTDYGLDMLKIDFLDQAMVYRDQPDEGDIPSIGHAMISMLSQLREQLDAAGHGHVAFEFRQPYVSPAIARYGQILRAHDCPGDSLTNRATIVDARLVSAGQIVHSDPMMWGQHALPHDIARQFYAGWFSVPRDLHAARPANAHPNRHPQGPHRVMVCRVDHHARWRVSLTAVDVAATPFIHARRFEPERHRRVLPGHHRARRQRSHRDHHPQRHRLTTIDHPLSRPSAGVIRSLDGAQLQPIEPHPGGLVELLVPTFGVATLQSDDGILGSTSMTLLSSRSCTASRAAEFATPG